MFGSHRPGVLDVYQTASVLVGFGSAIVLTLPTLKPPVKRRLRFGEMTTETFEALFDSMYDSERFARQATAVGLVLLILSIAFQVAGGVYA